MSSHNSFTLGTVESLRTMDFNVTNICIFHPKRINIYGFAQLSK